MRSQQIIEAEDPKTAMRLFGQSEHPFFSTDPANPKIWPSDDYFINLAKPEEEWGVGEFCPILIRQDGSGEAMDGMYGLSQDVSIAVNYGGAHNEDAYVAGMDQYEVPMWGAIEKGITSGILDGVVGPRRWRIVWHPDPHAQRWSADRVVPVMANRKYGEQMVRAEALESVERVLEGEDPKQVFHKMLGAVSGGQNTRLDSSTPHILLYSAATLRELRF